MLTKSACGAGTVPVPACTLRYRKWQVCLFFVEVDEAPYAAVKWRRGRDQAPLVWRPEGAPSTSKFQVATRWVSTNGVNSPVRNLATMQSYARWLRVQMNDPNPDARPRRVKPEELMELLMQLPDAVFGSSLHRELLVALEKLAPMCAS